MLISESIPNFLNGVSQQSPAVRLRTQCVEQVNGWSSPSDGLGKRPPTQHISVLLDSPNADALIHFIDRSETEQYVVYIHNGTIRVFDRLTGLEKTVTVTSPAASYLTATAAENVAIRCLTLADSTYVLNREVVTAIDPAETTASEAGAIIWFRQANYSTAYTVKLGSINATVTTGGTTLEDVNTSALAEDIQTALYAALPVDQTEYNIARKENVLYITRTDGLAPSVDVTDASGSRGVIVTFSRVQRFSDLPPLAPPGYKVEVTGDFSTDSDNYWVEFSADNGTDALSTGLWEESTAPGITYKWDLTTMPHVLTRNQDGSFTFSQAEWIDRLVGDDNTNKIPEINGYAIKDFDYHKGRLAMIAGTTSQFSRVSDFLNLWKQTAITKLDDDAFSLQAVNKQVLELSNLVEFQDALITFANRSQAAIRGNPVLTYKTADNRNASAYDSDPNCQPIPTGSRVHFAATNGEFGLVRELYTVDNNGTSDAGNITSHVPRYIDAPIIKLTRCTIENALIVQSSGNRSSLWVYRWYDNGSDRLQACWSRWDYGADVLGVQFIGTDLWLTVDRGGELCLEKQSVEVGAVDPDAEYQTYLDRRIDESDVTAVHDSGTNTTALTLPFEPSADVQVISRQEIGVPGGHLFTVSSVVGNVVTVVGNVSTDALYVGEPYEFSYTLSTLYKRDSTDKPITTSRLTITTLRLEVRDTAYLKINVTPIGSDTSTLIYRPYRFNQPAESLDSSLLGTESIEVPIGAKNDEVEITLVNDSPLPCWIVSGEWEGNYTTRSNR